MIVSLTEQDGDNDDLDENVDALRDEREVKSESSSNSSLRGL